MGQLLELKGENPFRIRAYENGARALESIEEDLDTLIKEKRLAEVKGIGKTLAEKIATLYEFGYLREFEQMKKSVPEGLVEMLDIPGLGPKKIKLLYEKLEISTIKELAVACKDGRLAGLSGLGKKTAENILKGIEKREAYSKRHLWWDAEEKSKPILEGLRGLAEVEKAESAGSLRRCMETVGDLDFLVASDNPGPIMKWFVEMESVESVSSHGETKSSVRLEGGIQADLRVVPSAQFYYALHHFTGSKDHNVRMRSRANERGLSLSEWGLAPKGKDGKMDSSQSKSIKSEEDLFKLLGLNYIPPELREDRGEIEWAEEKSAPDLVKLENLRGAFHNHTTESDGRNTLHEMVQAADDLGWEYFGLANHSKSSFQANGLDEERLEAEIESVDALNQSGKFKVRVLTGTECDILKDGSLDFSEDLLSRLDYVVVSVHQVLNQDEDLMTKRLIKAIEHPEVNILGHLTGRLLLRREGYPVNHNKIIDAAKVNKVVIELNANPQRLDMDWRYWRRAADMGVLCAINPDAHSTEGLKFVHAGILAARKGWLCSENILNTRPLKEVEKIFAK